MRVAILASGTRGDIQPLLAVGDELRRGGHSVVLTVNSNLVEWARRSGLDVVASEPDLEAFLKSERGRALLARGDLRTFAREFAANEVAATRAIVDSSIAAARDADLIVGTMVTVFRAVSLATALARPVGVLFTMPSPPGPPWTHPLFPVRKLWFRALDAWSYDFLFDLWYRGIRRIEDALRDALALPRWPRRPRVEDALAGAVMCSDHLMPGAYAGTRFPVTGFPVPTPALRQQLGEGAPPAGLDEWLAAGPAPVFFGFGSMPVLDPARLLDDVSAVCARRGVRALVGAGWSDYGREGRVPDNVFLASAFDHDRVLPRCVAAVHHGGAGTTAAAARAGLPALVASVFADQPFWGWRLEQQGVGVTMPFTKLNAARLDRALARLLDPATRARAQALGAALRAEDGAAGAAAVAASWATNPPWRDP